MTDPNHDDLSKHGARATPQTGHPAVDDALRDLADLASAPLEEHHDRLSRAHEALNEALDRADGDQSSDRRPS